MFANKSTYSFSDNDSKLVPVVMGIVAILLGLIMVFFGVIMRSSLIDFENNAETVVATITNIITTRERHGDDVQTNHDVFVRYTVEDIVYEQELGYYSSNMFVGNTIEIMYKPENPMHIQVNDPMMYNILFVIGFFVVLIGMCIIIYVIVVVSKHKRLINNGTCLQGIIVDIQTNKLMRVNDVEYIVVVCEVSDTHTGNTVTYYSEQTPADTRYKIGNTVNIYIDLQNSDNYYVDLKSVGVTN